MHPVVAVPELFSLIATECTANSATLASLARTCRRFCEPSLDALYGSTEVDLKDLAILPLEFGKEPDDREERDLMMTTDFLGYDGSCLSMSLPTWKRFDYYATKIKKIRISFDDFDDDVLITLHAKAQIHQFRVTGRPVLFPRIKSLALEDRNYEKFKPPHPSTLLPLLSPTLVVLSVTLSGCDTEVENLLGLGPLTPIINDLCPYLETVSVDIKGSSSEGAVATEGDKFLNTIAQQSQHLRVIDADMFGISPSTVRQFLCHPGLESLTVRSYEVRELGLTQGTPYQSSIKRLNLDFDTEAVISHLEAFSFPNLTDLYIYVNLTDMSEDYYERRIVKNLIERTSPESMEKFGLSLWSEDPVYFPKVRFLFEFKGLREVKLYHEPVYLPDGYQFCDCDVRLLSEALQQLRILALNKVSGLTIGCLIPLSLNCAHLIELDIIVDATVVPNIPRSITEGYLTNKVFQKLTVQDSPIYNSASVGRFLRRVFPSIRELDASTQLWSQVPLFMSNP